MALPKLLQKLFQNNGAGDKLNKSIVPDLDYLPKSGGTVNGSVTINGTTVHDSGSTETYKEGIKFGWGSDISQSTPNGLDIWAKRGGATTVIALYGEKKDGDTTGNTPGMLFRAGDGTNTKSMKLSATKGLTADVCELIRSAGQKELVIAGDDNDGCIRLIPGNDGSFSGKKSASLFLTSTGYTGNTVPAGSFYLSAMDVNTRAKTLAGRPDGSLTWDGHEVARVVSSGKSANGTQWYRKYNDGYIEQAGLFDYGSDAREMYTTITFLAPFSSSVYSVQVTPGTTGTAAWDGSVIAKDLTTTSMCIGFWGNAKPVRARYLYWFACGY